MPHQELNYDQMVIDIAGWRRSATLPAFKEIAPELEALAEAGEALAARMAAYEQERRQVDAWAESVRATHRELNEKVMAVTAPGRDRAGHRS